MTPNTMKLIITLVAPLALLFAVACSGDSAAGATDQPAGGAAPTQPSAKINVVTTSNIVADWARAVGRDRVEVFSLLPPNADPHTFQPGARDITRVADADLVLSVGLSLEGSWMEDLIRNAASDSSGIVALGEALDPIEFADLQGDSDHDSDSVSVRHDSDSGHNSDGDADGHGSLDPHFWFDPLRVKQAVDQIAAQLSAIDPDGSDLYRANSDAYSRELDFLHAWIQGEVMKVPEERRLLVTSHDNLQYFAQRYGFEVVGAVMPVTTEAEPTAQELAELIETIEHENAPAVFAEKSHSARMAQRIAEETGAKLIGGLYTGSLGEPGSEAGTYLDLMRYDVEIIVEALK